MIAVVVAQALLVLTGPDNQVVEINPAAIVSMRVPRHAEHFAPGTHCIVFTSDGKYTMVQEACSKIDDALRQNGFKK